MIYLDNAATALPDTEIIDLYSEYIKEDWFNPSSLYGYNTKKLLEKTRQNILELLGKKNGTVIFTSGGTESNNLAILGWHDKKKRSKNNKIITSYLEHPSSKLPAEKTEMHEYAQVLLDGTFNLESVKGIENVGLISCMHVNNEIGSIQPVDKIYEYCLDNNIIFHCDCVQSIGKFVVPNADLISISAHKLGGPRGIGALYISDRAKINPIIFGGGQEFDLRSGTENVAGALILEKLLEKNKLIDNTHIENLFDKMKEELVLIKDCDVLESENQSSYIMAVHIKGVMANTLQTALASEEIYVGIGSACSANTKKPSYVMQAIGKSKQEAQETIRISFSKQNTLEDIEIAGKKMAEIVDMLRRVKR